MREAGPARPFHRDDFVIIPAGLSLAGETVHCFWRAGVLIASLPSLGGLSLAVFIAPQRFL